MCAFNSAAGDLEESVYFRPSRSGSHLSLSPSSLASSRKAGDILMVLTFTSDYCCFLIAPSHVSLQQSAGKIPAGENKLFLYFMSIFCKYRWCFL